MRAQIRKILLIVPVVLPQAVKRAYYRSLFGWKIGRRVRIGASYIDAKAVALGDDVRIGHLNVFRNLKVLSVGEGTYIANLNQFFGAIYERFPSRVVVGRHVNFMSRHFVDAAGSVEIGDGAVIGGRSTQFWSHSRALINGVPSLEPTHLSIGEGVYVGAGSMLIGCAVPPGAVVGAGSVVAKSFDSGGSRVLIAGNPAEIKKRYTETPPPEDSPV